MAGLGETGSVVMPASGKHGQEPFAEINIIPFVDVVLVLLIVFMITAPVIFDTTIPLELPSAATGEEGLESDVGIIILEDGSLMVNGRRVSEDGLRAVVQNNPGARALLSADRDTPHGRVVEIIDLLRDEGIQRYAINVVPAEEFIID